MEFETNSVRTEPGFHPSYRLLRREGIPESRDVDPLEPIPFFHMPYVGMTIAEGFDLWVLPGQGKELVYVL